MKKELDFDKLKSANKEEKYSFVKELVVISENEPERIEPHFDKIIKMLDTDKNVVLWSALKIIGNIARADAASRISAIMPRLVAYLNSGNMITANNTINTLVKIALAKKELLDDIVAALLETQKFEYESLEHKNIIAGKAITALIRLFPKTNLQEQIKVFATNYIRNGRPEALARAEELLKELDKQKN
jgi:hypothetical protein